MGTRGSIGVRINDGTTDRTITADVRGLKFSKQADGGMRDASYTAVLPLGTFGDLGPSDKTYLTDTRTGATLWDGYLEAPTPTRGPGGQAFEISALGGMVRAADETRPLCFVTKELDQWVLNTDSAPSASGEVYTFDPLQTKSAGLKLQFNPGQPVGNGSRVTMGLYALQASGGVAAFSGFTGSGKVDTGYRVGFRTPEIALKLGNPNGITTSGISDTYFVGDNFPPTGVCVIDLLRFGGATNVADDTTWTGVSYISVLGQRFNRYGVNRTGQAQLRSANNVLAAEVVEDLLGRVLTFCDPAASSVAATTAFIDQLAYIDGTTAQAVLDDLGDYEPDMLWEILQSTSSGPMGKHVFNYRPWPTTPRYEIGGQDGYSESGADVDLANRVAVTWTDIDGAAKVTVVTADADQYPPLRALEVAGRIRDAEPVALPDGQGSEVNALALGAAILADKNTLGTSARATIRRPITDLYTGRRVMPWEIEPGHLARVRETGLDLRLTEMEYDDDECATAVTLGYPSRTRDQRIAALAKVA